MTDRRAALAASIANAILESSRQHEACSLLAAETLIQAEAMRQQFELTGRRPWDAKGAVIN
ncbi:hypothetical protein [Sphingomonas oryzagri]